MVTGSAGIDFGSRYFKDIRPVGTKGTDGTPSRTDIAMTREIAAAAKALKIEVHDHLIIGRGRHASFKALGLL